MILHITNRTDWEKAKEAGAYISPSLSADGFIHCSTPGQTAETANLFFKGQNDLVLLCIDEIKLNSECKYEEPAGAVGIQHDPRGDNLFPHVYGPVNFSAVVNVVSFPPDKDGIFKLPVEIET